MRNLVKHTKSVINIVVLTASIVACSNAQFSTTATSAGTTGGTGTTTCTTNCGTTPPPTATCSASTTVPLNVTGGLANGNATINLYNTGDGVHYYGNVSVSYTYYGAPYTAFYSAPAGNNVSIQSLNNNGQLTSAYNYWNASRTNFSGFFQNQAGALVLSVSSVDSNGCASGALYYENFNYTGAVQSPFRECWYITEGPFDCQDAGIMSKTSLVPGGGYTLLGTFSGLPTNLSFQ